MTFPPQGGPQGPFDPRNPNDPRNGQNPRDPQQTQGQGQPPLQQGQPPNHGQQGPSGSGAYGTQHLQQPQYGQQVASGQNSNQNSNSNFGPSAASAYGAPSAVTPGYATPNSSYATPNSTYAAPNGTYGVPGTGYGAPAGAPQVGNPPTQGFGYQQQPSGYPTQGAPGSEFGAAPGAAQPGKPQRNSRLLLILAIPAAALIAGLGGYFIGESNGSVLAAEPLQAEVTRVLQDDFGLVEVSDVVCPEQVKVDQGSEFQCTFTYAEQDQSVTVTVSSADGQVVVGAPE